MDHQLGTLVVLYSQSYLGQIGIGLNNLDSLVKEINRLRKNKGRDAKIAEGLQITTEYRYLEYLSDAIEKLGFLYFARDKMKNNEDIPTSKYYIYNFIFDCKALLDTIAGLINHHYELRKRKGGIDLNKPRFVKALYTKNPLLSKDIENFGEWIKWINRWRLDLIHRHGLFMYTARLMPTSDEPEGFASAMFNKTPAVDSLRVVEECIKNAKHLLETVIACVRDDLLTR